MNLDDPTLLRTDSYVNGAWTAAPGDRRFAVTNPATGETVADVADLGAAETIAARQANWYWHVTVRAVSAFIFPRFRVVFSQEIK